MLVYAHIAGEGAEYIHQVADLAAYRDQWRVLCGAKARGIVHSPPKHPRDIWAQVVDGPPPSNTVHPTKALTRPRRQQPRTPAPTPELNATQKWGCL